MTQRLIQFDEFEAFIFHFNCAGCEDPLDVHMRPLGWCQDCLKEDTFTILESEQVPVIFTLRMFENWLTMDIATCIGARPGEVEACLHHQPNIDKWRHYLLEVLHAIPS